MGRMSSLCRASVLTALGFVLSGLWMDRAEAQQATGTNLSLIEIELADCVGLALALEEALRDISHERDAPELLAARAQADEMLRVSLSRYVGVGRVAAFQRRAALATSATSLRMAVAVRAGAMPHGVISRNRARFQTECSSYLD